MSSINVIPGQASHVTVLVGNPNGEKWVGKFIAPPGRDAVLPDNIATKDQLGQMISGVMGMAPTDAQGLGIHWSVEGRAIFVYGNDPNNAASTDIIAGDNGVYRTSDNRCLPRMDGVSKKYIWSTYQSVSNGVRNNYPTAFAPGSSVQVFVTPSTKNGQTPSVSMGATDSAGFTVNFPALPDGSTTIPAFILAIGDLA